jgi:hypothetical protein
MKQNKKKLIITVLAVIVVLCAVVLVPFPTRTDKTVEGQYQRNSASGISGKIYVKLDVTKLSYLFRENSYIGEINVYNDDADYFAYFKDGAVLNLRGIDEPRGNSYFTAYASNINRQNSLTPFYCWFTDNFDTIHIEVDDYVIDAPNAS